MGWLAAAMACAADVAAAEAATEDNGRSAVLAATCDSHVIGPMEFLPSLAQEIDAALAGFDGSDEAVRRALSRFRKAFQLAKVGCATI